MCPYFTLTFGEYSLTDCGKSLRSDRMGECLSQEVCAPILLCGGVAHAEVATRGLVGMRRDTLITLELMRRKPNLIRGRHTKECGGAMTQCVGY